MATRTRTARQWMDYHMKDLKIQPNGDRVITLRVDAVVVTKRIPYDIWQSALQNSNIMAELRLEFIRSMRGRTI